MCNVELSDQVIFQSDSTYEIEAPNRWWDWGRQFRVVRGNPKHIATSLLGKNGHLSFGKNFDELLMLCGMNLSYIFAGMWHEYAE